MSEKDVGYYELRLLRISYVGEVSVRSARRKIMREEVSTLDEAQNFAVAFCAVRSSHGASPESIIDNWRDLLDVAVCEYDQDEIFSPEWRRIWQFVCGFADTLPDEPLPKTAPWEMVRARIDRAINAAYPEEEAAFLIRELEKKTKS